MASQGLWSVGSHFSMTFTPSPLLVVSNASRAFSRGKRCVTKGLTLIRLDASRAIATGHLQGKQRADESSHQFGAPQKQHGGAQFHYSNFQASKGKFCPQSSGEGTSCIRTSQCFGLLGTNKACTDKQRQPWCLSQLPTSSLVETHAIWLPCRSI